MGEDGERQELKKIHEGIDAEIQRRGVESSAGAVPRSLGVYREKSPGDMSPDAPPGTPTREEGRFLQSRGEGLPMTRAGGPPLPAAPDQKKRYWEQKELRQKAKREAAEKRRGENAELAQQRKSFKVANSPVKVQDFARFIHDEQRRLQLLSGRIESFLIAVSIVSSQVSADSQIREFCERFKMAIPEANEMWTRWRDTINSIADGGMNLVDINRIVREWNDDLVRPRIARNCFNPHWILWLFGLNNPDATLSLEERKEFAAYLGYSAIEVEAMVAGSFPKPGQE